MIRRTVGGQKTAKGEIFRTQGVERTVHESALCDAIVEAALRRAAGRQVVGVRVRIAGHPVNHRVIDEDFRLAAAGTRAADAAIDLVVEPLASRCRACGFVTPATDALAMVACTWCESLDIEAVGDDRPVLESVTFRHQDTSR
ncbi:MAG TPA: hydrogenase/urease maturation nickel metallochaperone HypA [Streptosporangiaceae bacterium]